MEEVKYKFFVYSDTFTDRVEVFPKNANNLAIEFERKENRALLSSELKGNVIFSGEDYALLKSIEQSDDLCIYIDFIIQRACNGQFEDFYFSNLSLTKGNWNADTCSVSIEAFTVNKYRCFERDGETERDIFKYTIPKQTITLVEGQLEFLNCSGESDTPVSSAAKFCGTNINEGWVTQSEYDYLTYLNASYTEVVHYRWAWTYVREYRFSSTPLPAPWQDIGGNKWVKQPIKYRYENQDFVDLGNDDQGRPVRAFTRSWFVGGQMDNGMKMKDVLEAFMGEFCPGLTLKSDFFQWNPENPSSINYVTGQESEILNLILFQRSDVKRPSATNNATIAETTWKDLLDDLVKMFNLKWDILDGKFVIEHVSFFYPDTEENLIGRFDDKLRIGFNEYTYDIDNMPLREIFEFSATKYYTNQDFKGVPIIYDNNCAGTGTKVEERYTVNELYTDVPFCFLNPSSDSDFINDEGFVLVACNADNRMIARAGILGPSELNNVLSWALLMERYYKWERPFPTFNMNNTIQQALSVRRNKIQVPIIVVSCCGDVIDVDSEFITELGGGVVRTATYDIFKETFTLELSYL